MSDNNKLPKQAKPQAFELVELLFREYVSSHIARPAIEYSFQARFQSFINQIPSYLHSSSKTGFFTHFFFGSFASLLDTKLADKLGIQKLHFNFDRINNLRIVAETGDKTHVFIFTENKNNKKQKQKKDIGFTKDEWKKITGREYTDDDNKKLEISVIQINKSTGSINVAVEKQDIQDGASSIKQYHEITKQCVDKDGQYIALENEIVQLSVGETDKSEKAVEFILKYTQKIHAYYQGLPYGDKAQEADEHGFVAGILNNFRYRENAYVYLEQFAGKGYADMVLLVRGSDRTTKSIPIIIELKAGTASGTSSDDALKQVAEYTKGFQPNNMRILSLADNILCVGMNLDSPSDSFMQMQVVDRDQAVAPLIQSLTDAVKKVKDSNIDIIKQEIQSNLEKTYNTFPGTGEKSSAHYMSRFLLGESLVLQDYDKHIFIYDQKSYIPTATVRDDHGTRSKKPKIEKIVDGSNAVNSILLISKDKDNPAIVLNVIDVNREVNDVIKLPLDVVTVGNRKIISLDIEFRLDKYKEGFQQYCDVEIGKIYNSVFEYNNENTIKADGTFAKISCKDSVELVSQLKSAIDAQNGLVFSESRYKELIGKVGEIVYPMKSLIGRESEFQGLLEGIFKYYSDLSLSEGVERRALVFTEFQTGAGGRIDMLMQAIGPSEKGSKEYIPVGLELKYDDSIKLNAYGRKQDEHIQKILLERQEQQVIQRLLNEQIERYANGAAIKSITDGNKVAIMGVVFNGQSQESSKLLLTTDKFIEANVVHSSKLYTISDGVMVPNINDLPAPDSEEFIPDWVEQEILDEFAKMQGEDRSLLSLFNKHIDDDKITRLQNVLKNKEHVRTIDGIDLSYNDLTAKALPGLVKILGSKLIYLDLSDNDLAQDNFDDFKESIKKIEVPILKISDIGMTNKQMRELISLLKKQDKIAHLEIQHLESQRMADKTAHSIGKYIEDTNMLDYLDLSRCEIKNTAARIIANSLRGQDTLRTLILRDNKIDVYGAEKFKTTLPNSAILHFDLSGNPLGVTGFANIVEGVVSSSSNVEELKLVDVGIKYNRDNRVQAEHLTNAINSLFSNKKLTSIDISYNDIGTGLLSQTFYILSKSVDDHSLRDINLAGNQIDLGSHQATINSLKGSIKAFFDNNKTIRSLGMADMDLDDELGEEIAKGLEKSGLIHLDLSGNTNLDIKTISALASTLCTHQYLKYLNLSDIKLNIQNIKILFDAAKNNDVLTHLALSHNDLSGIFTESNGNMVIDLDHQAIDFQSLLKGNTSLKYINLSHCKLTTNSMKSLFALLKENSSIEVLDIRGNLLDEAIVDYIVEALIDNAAHGLNGLKQLYIDKGHLSDESLRKLTDKSLGISVLVDYDVQHNVDLSTELEKMEIEPACAIKSLYDKNVDKYNGHTTYGELGAVFETATVRDDHSYWLQDHDVTHIARVHYQNLSVRVLSTHAELSHILKEYRKSKDTDPFTIIINVNSQGALPESGVGIHWVSVVLQRVNNEYNGYYVDSFGNSIASSLAELLNVNHIRIHDIGIDRQQHDGYNCGLWALENAQTIRNVLLSRPNSNIEDVRNSLSTSHDEAYFRNLRHEIFRELIYDEIRVEFLEAYGVDVGMLRSNSNDYDYLSSQYQHTTAILTACLLAYNAISQSRNKREILKKLSTKSTTVVDGKSFLDCTDKLTTDLSIAALIKIFSKFHIRNDDSCVRVNDFILEQEIIDAIKKEMPDIGFNMHLMMKNTSALISMAATTHNIALFKVVCTRYGNELKTLVDRDQRTLLHNVIDYVDARQWIELLIKQGLNIDAQDSAGNTALYYAIIECKYEVIKLLINNGASINVLNKEGNSLLLYSIMHSVHNNFAIPKLLIEQGANINILNNNNTALYLSVLKNDTYIVEFLLDHKANVNMHNNGNDTALNAAISMNNTLMVDLLLKHGANINGTGQNGNTPIMIATAVKNKELVRKLIESNADVNAKNNAGYSAISIIAGGAIVAAGVTGAAVVSGGVGIVSWIGSPVATVVSAVGTGVSGTITHMVQGGRQGYTRIESNSDVAEIRDNLINHGANLNTANNFGNTPVHNAVESWNYEMVEFVSNRGININAMNNEGNTALHIATNNLRYRGRSTRDVQDDSIMEKIIALLIARHADISIKNNAGETAIYLAAIKQNTKIIKSFLEVVKDSTILLWHSNSNKKSVLELVFEHHDNEIGLKIINFKDLQGKSIIAAAVLNKDHAAVQLLVKNGADININDIDNNTPIHLAKCIGDTDMIKYLIGHGADIYKKNHYDQFGAQDPFVLKMFKDALDKYNNSMLMHIVKEHDVETVSSLLRLGINLDIQNKDGNTALHIAILEKQLMIYHLLLEYKADTSIKNLNGKTAGQLAHETSFIDKCQSDIKNSFAMPEITLEELILQKLSSTERPTTVAKYILHKPPQKSALDIRYDDGVQKRHKRAVEDIQSISDTNDSRYDAIVQVQNAIGARHTIERDVSKFIDSKASPVVNSVYNKLVVDWQGNLLLGYLLFGKKCSGAKCEITQEVINEPKNLEYAQRLAYSSYASVIEQNIENTELLGEV